MCAFRSHSRSWFLGGAHTAQTWCWQKASLCGCAARYLTAQQRSICSHRKRSTGGLTLKQRGSVGVIFQLKVLMYSYDSIRNLWKSLGNNCIWEAPVSCWSACKQTCTCQQYTGTKGSTGREDQTLHPGRPGGKTTALVVEGGLCTAGATDERALRVLGW